MAKKEKIEISDRRVLEENTLGAPVRDIAWGGVQVETPEVQIKDPGMGRPIIMRTFFFMYNPTIKGRPSKEQLLTPDYLRYLNNLLRVDELELIKEPNVVYRKKGFYIFATCQPRKGSRISSRDLEQLVPLQDRLHKRK